MRLQPSRDLGVLDGPVLLFGGPYSNLQATQTMHTEAKRLGIPPGRCICTGDVVAYCADPVDTLAQVLDWGIPVVMGNCEESLAEAAPDCGCGFEEGSTCSVLSVDWYEYASRRVSRAQREWMARLPRSIRFELNGKQVLVVHGSPQRINEFVFPSSDEQRKRAQLDECGVDLIVGGHCGIPFGQPVNNGAWLNSGAIGMPANDGATNGWYLLLQPEAKGVCASWHRLEFDYQKAAETMRMNGLDNGYAEALETGYWPSADVLPEHEKRLTYLQRVPMPLMIG